MLCVEADGCRGAVARHSGPAVFREKINERYGELIVDVLIDLSDHVNLPLLRAAAAAKLRERNCRRNLREKPKKHWLKYIKDVLSSQGFSTQARHDNNRKLHFPETLSTLERKKFTILIFILA
jgi:hypothetical protein